VADTFNVLSLFTGGAGLDVGLGLVLPNARTVAVVERECFAVEVLAEAFESGALEPCPVWTDVRTFDGKPWNGLVDCIVGGYPCQPFSVAGKGLGTDDHRHLWPEVARIVAEVGPSFCIFENVAGHVRLGLDGVWGDLRGMGYEVEGVLVRASDVGASHRRERLFLLAHRQVQGGQGE
jgi:DNA (cytosine-5)-methyltransferase 1